MVEPLSVLQLTYLVVVCMHMAQWHSAGETDVRTCVRRVSEDTKRVEYKAAS